MNQEHNRPVKPVGFMKSLWNRFSPTTKSIIVSLVFSLALTLAFRNVVFLFVFFAFPFGKLFGRKK